MNVSKKIRLSLEEKRVMRFLTSHPRGDKYDGVVMHATKSLVVLRSQTDFEFESIQILPRAEYTIQYKQLFKIQFDDKYTGYFNEYMKNCVGMPSQTENESD